MIYTFSFNSEFLDSFKNKINNDQATLIYHFINQNFIRRFNFYLKIEGKAKKFFNSDVNGGNGTLLKTLLGKLRNKHKNFPAKVNNVDFLFSNEKNKNSNIISFEKIFRDHVKLEEDLDDNYKSFWQANFNENDQFNKRKLSKALERIMSHSDEIYLIDRHAPRTLCKAKRKNRKTGEVNSNDKNYGLSYLNSFEFYNSIIKNKKINNRFFGGLLMKEFNDFNKEGLEVEKILKDSFNKFKDSKSKVHVISKHEAYTQRIFHERLIIGLINNDFFVMIKTEKGLNILDENYELNKDKKKFDFVREEFALDDWEDWKVNVRYVKPLIEFAVI